MGAVAVPRRYRSRLREQQAEQTRRAVVQAAHDLFVANGWAATGMREVATTAGVALETVYCALLVEARPAARGGGRGVGGR